jgi:hypothetical protein
MENETGINRDYLSYVARAAIEKARRAAKGGERMN